MPKFVDLSGSKFGKVNVIKCLERTQRRYYRYLCQCDCGKQFTTTSSHIRKMESCGCNRTIKINEYNRNHRKKNKIVVDGDIAYVYLSCSDKVAIIDKEDVEKVKDYTWRFVKGYAATYFTTDRTRIFYIHYFIIGKVDGKEVDHINRNKLDNRKCNLRNITHLENMHNVSIKRKSNTGIKNISKLYNGTYRVVINYNNKRYSVGTFKTIEEAEEKLEKFKKENNIKEHNL